MNIFLTGATGTIGGELAAQLITAGHSVTALVRRNRKIYSNAGCLLTAGILTVDDISDAVPQPGRISLISGDVAAPGLDMKEAGLFALAPQMDLVIHCAAITDFNASEAEYQRVNIDGVANVLAAFPDARFLHVSTAYACGLQNGPIPEAPCDKEQRFTNGYERSKAAGEALVLASGRQAVIARPSIVVGAYDDGSYHRFDSFYQLFRLIAEGHIIRLPATPDATLDLVPIDHVVGGLMDIIENWERAEGKIVHLSSGSAIPVTMLGEAISLFDHLDAPIFLTPEAYAKQELPILERRIYKRVAAFYASYFQRHPDFSIENLRYISGRRCREIDLAALERMIAHCINAGLIRSMRSQGKPT